MDAQKHTPWRIGNGDGGEPRQTDELVHIFDSRGERVAQWVRADVAPQIVAAPDALAVLRQMVEAYDSGNVEMNSPEIGEPENDIPLHAWHEEWLHYARAAVTKATA
jgi:hypothetical protein